MQIAKFKEKSLLFTLFLTLAIFAPLLKFQALTGTIVNALLFLTVLYLGLRAALVISLVPSVIAWAVGLLPFSLAVLIPVIMLSNCLLSTVFYFLDQKPYLLRAIVASVAKFAFLFIAAFLFGFYLSHELAMQANLMLGAIQLATSLLGAAVAYIVFRLKPGIGN